MTPLSGPSSVGDPSTVFLRQKVQALTDIASDVRQWIADAPADDPEVVALLRHCDTLDQLAGELRRPITLRVGAGIPANSPGTTGGTAR